MGRSVNLWQVFGFGVSVFLGTVLHFLYELSGEAVWIAPFSGVNESTWEHMKLLFWPMFAFAVVEWIFLRETAGFWCVKLRGILVGIVLIPILFYTYNGVIGKSPDWVNIAIFFIAAAVAFLYETRLFYSEKLVCKHPKISFATIIVIVLLFVIFTFATPKIGIFKDPLTGQFGI